MLTSMANPVVDILDTFMCPVDGTGLSDFCHGLDAPALKSLGIGLDCLGCLGCLVCLKSYIGFDQAQQINMVTPKSVPLQVGK
jgi:hypothetical protein